MPAGDRAPPRLTARRQHATLRTVTSFNVLSPPVSGGVVVVGAGVVGASVAYHAARAGAVVTLVDAGRPGAGVTANSFAWIGSSGVRTGPAAALRVAAMDEYRRLEAELPELPVTWSGSLSWRAGGS